jgi:hypothetical protein
MSSSASVVPAMPRAAGRVALCLAVGLALSGCAEMSDSMTTAFADPAAFDLYDCKQLEAERQSLAKRAAELQGLMAKAETGVGGSVVSELAYRNDYVAVRGRARFAEEAWRKNKCREGAASATPDAPKRPDIKPAPASRSGAAVY